MGRAELLRSISEIIERYAEAARGGGGDSSSSSSSGSSGASPEETARSWIDAGFEDAEEVAEWLDAGCFSARGAHAMELAGITPEQAAMRTRAGTADYEERIGYKITRGDLSLDEARRIITDAFWNS